MLVANLRLPVLLLRLYCPSLHVRNSGVPKRFNSRGTASVLKMCQGASSSSQIHRELRQRAPHLISALTLASGYTWYVSSECCKGGIDSNIATAKRRSHRWMVTWGIGCSCDSRKMWKQRTWWNFFWRYRLRLINQAVRQCWVVMLARSSGWLLGLLSLEKVKRKESRCTALYTGENKEVHCETRGFNQMQFANFWVRCFVLL